MNIFKLLTYNIREHLYCDLYLMDYNFTETKSFIRLLTKHFNRWLRNHPIRSYMQFRKQIKIEKSASVLFVRFSNNNARALEPIERNLPSKSYSVLDSRMFSKTIPWLVRYMYSFMNLWPLVKCYISGSKREKGILKERFEDHLTVVGNIVAFEKWLKSQPIKLVVLANDHSNENRAMRVAASVCGIKTMYAQHCSVTEDFPPLAFSYSFLDGEESFIKYISQENPKGQVYLGGNPRFDIIKKYRGSVSNRTQIGIASNALDNEDKVRELCTKLLANGFTNLTVRPHPGLPFDPQWYLERGIEYSDSNTENPFEFLSRMKYVISGECGIHLDAALMDVCAIYYNMTDGPVQDVYSFVANDITYMVDTVEQMVHVLHKDVNQRVVDVSTKMQWYNAAYGKPTEGHIGEMMADFIQYQQAGDIDGFDKRYGFVEKEINGVMCKVYKE